MSTSGCGWWGSSTHLSGKIGKLHTSKKRDLREKVATKTVSFFGCLIITTGNK